MIFELIPTTIRMSTPLALAALGGIYSERSGVVNIGLEGMMLMGAFGYVIGTPMSGGTWGGLIIGIGCGGAIALLHAIASIRFRADAIVSGVAVNLLAVGITEFIIRGATSQRVAGLPQWRLPWLGDYAFIVYLTLLLVIVSQVFLFKTPWGLRLCVAGESTEALNALGLSRAKWQYIGVLISGLLAGGGRLLLGIRSAPFHQRHDSRTRLRGVSRRDFWKMEALESRDGLPPVRLCQCLKIGKSVANPIPTVGQFPLSAHNNCARWLHRQIKSTSEFGETLTTTATRGREIPFPQNLNTS